MSADLVYTDYVTPGDRRHPTGARRRNNSMAWAYSQTFNPRRLESPFYGVWGDTFLAIIDDDDALIVIPQLSLYRRRGQLQPDPQLLLPNTSATTEAIRKEHTDEVIPDFVVASMTSRFRHNPNPNPTHEEHEIEEPVNPSWNLLRVLTSKILGFFELKRPVRRNIMKPSVFVTELSTALYLAVRDVEGQAALYFNTRVYTSHGEVLLLAISGEWYQWKIARREDYPLPQKTPKGWPKGYHKKKLQQRAREEAARERNSSAKSEEISQEAEEQEDEDENSDTPSDNASVNLESELSFFKDLKDDDNTEDSERREEEEAGSSDLSGENADGFSDVDSSRGQLEEDVVDDVHENHDIGEDETSDTDDEDNPNRDAPPINRFENITGFSFENVVNNIDDAWPPTDDWSGWLRLGTPASNQRLYLIDRFMRGLTSPYSAPASSSSESSESDK